MNSVTLLFPTVQHANAFALWVEQTDLDAFFDSKACITADRLAERELINLSVELDVEGGLNVEHQITFS